MLPYTFSPLIQIWALLPWLALPVACVTGFWIWRRYRQWQPHLTQPSIRTTVLFGWPIVLTAGASMTLSHLASLWSIIDLDITQEVYRELRNKQLRANFIINRPITYGSFTFPAKTRLIRDDPFDNGTTDYPLVMNNLKAAYFPTPTQIAGVWAHGLDWNGAIAEVRLARDATLWVEQNLTSTGSTPASPPLKIRTICRKGATASFETPSVGAPELEWNDQEPIGQAAFFHPSQWRPYSCNEDRINTTLFAENDLPENPVRLYTSQDKPAHTYVVQSLLNAVEGTWQKSRHTVTMVIKQILN